MDKWQHHEGYITPNREMPSLPRDNQLTDRELYIYYAALLLGVEIAIQAMEGDKAAAALMDEILATAAGD